jgi:hypothetical protein
MCWIAGEGYIGPDGKPAGEGAGFKIKSRRMARDINVTMKSGRTNECGYSLYNRHIIHIYLFPCTMNWP